MDNPVYHRIVRVFLEDLRQRLASLEAAIKAGAQDAVEREAHSIKGAAATVGAAAIATIAAALETAAERGEALALSVMFARLGQVSAAGISWLESLLAGDVSS